MNKFDSRLKNILDAASFIEPEKVPVGFDCIGWPYGYAGTTLEAVVSDPAAHAEAYCKFMDEIEFDFTMATGFYEPYDAFKALGSSCYSLCADKCAVQHGQAGREFMEDEEYELLIRDPDWFRLEHFPKKSVPAFRQPREKAYEMLKEAARLSENCVRASELIADKTMNEYGVVPIRGAGTPRFYSPIDLLFDNYRGMMGVFCDLSDNAESLDAACEAIAKADAKFARPVPERVPEWPFGFSVYHCAPFLNAEQYDKYWFQGFKKALLPYAEKGLKIYIKGEGSFLHTIERFKEFPRGSVIIQLDADEPADAHRLIGGWQTLCTGMRTSLLRQGDIQKCIDHVKKSFDTLAPGGGFMFYQDKPLLSPSDASTETVREVWRFANEYSRRR